MPLERTLLVTVHLDTHRREPSPWSPEDEAAELRELAVAAGCEVAGEAIARRHTPVAGTFLGSGKIEELAAEAARCRARTVVISRELSPAQQRNLEELLGVKTLDRTQLILDIFAQRAQSQEGQVQVELAQLAYLLPRLVGKGIALSRLGGGIGTRGPGEQKLEMDRRRIRERMTRLRRDLEQLERRREAIRLRRREAAIPVIALIGYTNAGKTTLLNRLTGAEAVARNQLFTTLDPLARRLRLPGGTAVIVTDTVGFLHHLPHHLIEAFKATLEEARDATLVLHVLDAAQPRAMEHATAVDEVRRELGLDARPTLTVLNKCDLASDGHQLEVLHRAYEPSVVVSAKTGQGIEALLAAIESRLTADSG